MQHSILKFVLIFILAAVGSGCRSVEVASQDSGPALKCDVHGTEMHPEWIRVSSAEIKYLITYGYLDDLKRFPHHGGELMSGERGFRQPLERRVRDFVCPDCTRAHEAYWKIGARS